MHVPCFRKQVRSHVAESAPGWPRLLRNVREGFSRLAPPQQVRQLHTAWRQHESDQQRRTLCESGAVDNPLQALLLRQIELRFEAN
jgi:hypothetical protein